MALRPLTAPATLLRGRRPGAAVRGVRRPRASVWLRRLAAVAALGLALTAAYMLWFRDSSFVAVKDVRIEGVSAISDPEVAASLERAASGMTTLHIDTHSLAAGVSGYPTVKSLSVDAGFPSSLDYHRHRACAGRGRRRRGDARRGRRRTASGRRHGPRGAAHDRGNRRRRRREAE